MDKALLRWKHALYFALLVFASCSRPAAVRSGATADDAFRFFMARRIGDGGTELPLEKYEAAREHMRQMRTFSFARPGEPRAPEQTGAEFTSGWTNLGPGNIGGRTRSLLIDPHSPSIMYAGSVTGGVWKTTDAGTTWNVLTDLLPVLNIGAMAMDPVDSRIIYAGTGESYSGFQGQGIFKTLDGGATWTQLPATKNFIYTNKLIVSTKNAQRVYAATSTGVWTSPDGGATWTQSLGSLSNGCQDLALRSDTPGDYLFAACTGAIFNSDYTIWRNEDAAGTSAWNMVQSVPHMNRTSLALAPSQQSTIYAMAAGIGHKAGYDRGLLAVFRSTANGDPGTWSTRVDVNDPNLVNTELLSSLSCVRPPPPEFYSQGGYDNVLAVDPRNPNVVWAGGVNLFRSDDGGASWTAMPGVQTTTIAAKRGIHHDQHAIVFHPAYDGATNRTMYVGNDGGLFRTDNALAPPVPQPSGTCPPTALSVTWADLNTNYVATQYYHGVAYAGGNVYFGGAQDNGTSRGTDATGPGSWTWLTGGDGASVAIDPADANTIFVSTQNLALQRSNDNGATFKSATAGITEENTTFPFIAALAMDPNNGRQMYLGGAASLWRTTDSADSWTAAAPVEARSSVSTIAVSPGDSNTVLFGTASGRVYRSSNALAADGSAAWQFSLPRTGNVAAIAFDWQNPKIVYATYSTFKSRSQDAHVYKSTDGGVTWSASDGAGPGAIPDIPVFRLVVNPRDSSMLFLATDLGVLVSTDGGVSWQRGTSPFGNVVTEDLALDQGPQSQWLFAFTYGRGAWRAALPGSSPVACSYSVTPASIDAPPWGGVYPVSVTAPAGCSWIALPGSDTAVAHVQSPASGTGNSTAWVVAEPWFANRAAQTLTIAGQKVTVSVQAGATGTPPADEPAAAPLITVPAVNVNSTQNSTSNPDDPVHSCTRTADSHTAWWRVTPSDAGTLQVQGLGRRLTSGNYGLVLTAYFGTTPSPATELACTVVARDTGPNRSGVLRFPVAAGATYLIEASAAGSNATDVGMTALAVTNVPGVIGVSIAPGTAQVTAGGGIQQFTGTVTNGPNPAVRWTLSPPIGTVSPGGLYTAPPDVDTAVNVTLTASTFASPQAQASATIRVLPRPITLSAAGIVNAASFHSGPVAPGEIVTIFGDKLGPPDLAGAQFDAQGKLAATLAGTQVLFDDVPAPLIYSYATQLSAIVPYEVAGHATTQVVVSHNGQRSAPVTMPVTATAPALFTASSKGSGPGAILNQDGRYNSVVPAARGSFVTLFATGEGQTIPAGANGSLAGAILPKPAAPVSVKIGGIDAEIQYAGAAPGEVAGVLQVNVRVPGSAPVGQQPIVVTVGENSSPSNVTVSVTEMASDPALVAWWRFDETSGTEVVDFSGAGNTGVLTGTFQRVAGQVGGAVFFGGTSHVDGTQAALKLPTGSGPRTISAWIKIPSGLGTGADRAILHYGTNDTSRSASFHLFVHSDATAGIGNANGGGVIFGKTRVDDGAWHHVAGVYEGSATNRALVYVDGQLNGSGTLTTVPNTGAGGVWKIAQFLPGQGTFPGTIDELRVYNRALTAAEIGDVVAGNR